MGAVFLNEDYLYHFGSFRRSIADNVTFTGSIKAASETAKALVRTIFHAYADEHEDELYLLVALFESRHELEEAMEIYALARFSLTELSYD